LALARMVDEMCLTTT